MKREQFTSRHFRGITTVEDVRQRCHIDPITECWHWKGATSLDERGRPGQRLWVFDSQRGKFRVMSGPLAVLELSGSRTPETTTGWRKCLCDDCMNPAHMLGGTRADWGAWLKARGHWKNNPRRLAATRTGARARSKLTMETVRAIRESSLNGLQAAAAFGLTPTHVSNIRQHRSWKETVLPGASVFTLGMR